jgi:hypothetical protein
MQGSRDDAFALAGFKTVRDGALTWRNRCGDVVDQLKTPLPTGPRSTTSSDRAGLTAWRGVCRPWGVLWNGFRMRRFADLTRNGENRAISRPGSRGR